MKLKKVFGAFTVLATLAFASTAYASNEKINIGTPIDLATGQEVTEYVAGQKLLVPVDVSNDEQKAFSYNVHITYDTDALTAGIDGNTFSDKELEVISGYLNTDMTNIILSEGSENMYGSINRITKVTLGKTSFAGTANNNVDHTLANGTRVLSMTWYDGVARNLNADAPEAYALFTVKAPVEALNFDLFGVIDGDTSMMGSDNVDTVTVNSANKANACYGAFNINIDSSALPYWIQGLKVAVNGGSKVAVTEYKTTDNVNYTFPVRVVTNSTNASTATVEVFADTSADEAGNTDAKSDVSMGTFEIQLNSPTAYADNTVSAQ